MPWWPERGGVGGHGTDSGDGLGTDFRKQVHVKRVQDSGRAPLSEWASTNKDLQTQSDNF